MSTFGSGGSWGQTPSQRAVQQRKLQQLAARTAALLVTKVDIADGTVGGDVVIEGGAAELQGLDVAGNLDGSGRLAAPGVVRQEVAPYSAGYVVPSASLAPGPSDAMARKLCAGMFVNPEGFNVNPPNVQMRYTCIASSPVGTVALGYNFADRGAFSEDGINWSRITNGIAGSIGNLPVQSWYGITWSQELGIFCAVATDGVQRVATSPDGKNWTLRDTAVVLENCNAHPDISNGVVCSSTTDLDPGMQLHLIAGSGVVSGTVVSIIDDTTFTTSTALSELDDSTIGANQTLFSVAWSPELHQFCAIVGFFAPLTPIESKRRVLTSNDGVTWRWQIGGLGSEWNKILWAKELGKWVVSGYQGLYRIMTSNDGIEWSYPSTPGIHSDFWTIAWSSDLNTLCAGSLYSSTHRIATSQDGAEWTIRAAPWSSLSGSGSSDMLWIPDIKRFFSCHRTTNALPDNNWTSADALLWEQAPALSTSIEMGGATWSEYLKLVFTVSPYGIEDASTVYKVARTFLRGRVPAPLITFGYSANRIDEQGNWAIQQVLKPAAAYVAGSTTPSVARCAQLLTIANAAPTSITDFTDGQTHQQLTLVFSDANTTLVHNAAQLCLRGGVDFVSTSNDVLVLVRSAGGKWLEMSRSLNSP
jgi:hypothetical protein